MDTPLSKARDWFVLENYRLFDRAPDFSIFRFLENRLHLYSYLAPFFDDSICAEKFYGGGFSMGVNAPALLRQIREEDEIYQLVKRCETKQFISCGCYTDQQMDEVGWTPDWLRQKGYSCTSVRPMSVLDVARARDDLMSDEPNFCARGEFHDAIERAIDDYNQHDGETLSGMPQEKYSFDEFLLDVFDYHTGIVSLNIDLSAKNEQIAEEVKLLLPHLRALLKKPDTERSISLESQAFLGPSTKPRDTRKIDLTKVRDYRVPALVDLLIWSVVENTELKPSDYLRLVFPGDLRSDERVSEENIAKTYLPYAHKCMNEGLICALYKQLELERKQ